MKARPYKYENAEYTECSPAEATHVKLSFPGPTGSIHLPVAHGGGWTWNGSVDRPTLKPSVLTRTGHFSDHHKAGGECWCTYAKAHPEEAAPFACYRCHSFVTDGKVMFLADCSHGHANKTLDMLEVD